MSDFKWDDLQAFLAMARAGRLTIAAQRLGMDHSTLSRRISALETSLGAALFERRSVGFVLTPEGERLIADAEAIETLALRMRSGLKEGDASLSGTVRIGTPEGFGTYFLAPRIARLVSAHPDLEIELVAKPRSFSLSKREADLAISMSRPVKGRVYARKLMDYELGLYSSVAYLKRKPAIYNRTDLLGLQWIGYVEDLMWTPELDFLPEISREIDAQLRVSNVITQMMALAGGAGIGVLPHFMARHCAELIRVLPNDIHLTRSYWLVTHADTRDLARVERVTAFMQEELQAVGDQFWKA